MTVNLQDNNRRVLVIDDSPEIHADFTKILCPASPRSAELARLQAALFGGGKPAAAAGGPGDPPFVVDSALQGEQAAARVRAAVEAGRPYAVAFVDMRMPPGWDGLRTIRELWALDPALNVVVCTAYSDHAWSDIEALAGESDQLIVLKKPFEAIEVKRLAATLTAKWNQALRSALRMGDLESLVRVRTAELEFARQEDRKRMGELEGVVQARATELRRAATHDELTGLPNRALFHDRLVQAVERCRREPGHRVAVLFIDFDRFKHVNDSLGHHAGDQLLQSIAGRLTAVLRSTDSVAPAPPIAAAGGADAAGPADGATAARLGGDEFCVLLTGLARDEDAAAVATRVLQALERPYQIEGREVQSTASIGIAVSSTGYARAEDMVRDADTAMYKAKAAGKGRFVMFDPAMHAQAVERLTVAGDLRRAVERRELRTYYQPIVSLSTGRLTGFEALVRWDRGTGGVIGPTSFIPVAEETGSVCAIDDWVLADACRQMADWRRRIPAAGEATLSVNVSPKQLADVGLRARVERVLADTGLDPAALIVEITEAALVEKSGAAAGVIAGLKALGVRVYVDDFGTGYASLSSLQRFPLDGLKIDRSFLVDGPAHRVHAAVVYAIATLAHNLNLDVVAEGVESLAQVAMLQSVDCDKAQGYLFAPPAPSEEAEAFIARTPWRVAA